MMQNKRGFVSLVLALTASFGAWNVQAQSYFDCRKNNVIFLVDTSSSDDPMKNWINLKNLFENLTGKLANMNPAVREEFTVNYAIVRFNGNVGVFKPFTNHEASIEGAINAAIRQRIPGSGSTNAYDALVKVNQLFAQQAKVTTDAREILITFSDGLWAVDFLDKLNSFRMDPKDWASYEDFQESLKGMVTNRPHTGRRTALGYPSTPEVNNFDLIAPHGYFWNAENMAQHIINMLLCV